MSGGRTALVTGATSGIGAAFARRLARDGWQLMLHGRRREQLEALAAGIRDTQGVGVEVILAEFAQLSGIEVVARRIREHGSVGLLVNNAGFGSVPGFVEDRIDVADAMVSVHVSATMRLTHAALPSMLAAGSGTIINVSSIAGFLPLASSPVYASTKAWVTSFTESLAADVAPRGIRMQALCPGFTRSDFHSRIGLDPEQMTASGPLRFMSAERCVELSLAALGRGPVAYIPGVRNQLVIGLARMLPRGIIARVRAARKSLAAAVRP
jgi:short-subunit dehydrogenase